MEITPQMRLFDIEETNSFPIDSIKSIESSNCNIQTKISKHLLSTRIIQ